MELRGEGGARRQMLVMRAGDCDGRRCCCMGAGAAVHMACLHVAPQKNVDAVDAVHAAVRRTGMKVQRERRSCVEHSFLLVCIEALARELGYAAARRCIPHPGLAILAR